MSTPGRELVASDVPGTPARVMNAGTALSREVGQELAAVVERTARRERLRRRTGLVTVPGTLALYGLFVWATAPSDADVESIVAAFCGLAALPLALLRLPPGPTAGLPCSRAQFSETDSSNGSARHLAVLGARGWL